jgi:hypothetical protein
VFKKDGHIAKSKKKKKSPLPFIKISLHSAVCIKAFLKKRLHKKWPLFIISLDHKKMIFLLTIYILNDDLCLLEELLFFSRI